MPIYEYQCQACEQVSDALQKFSDDPLVTCPECGKDELKKLISAPRFRLAGSGWYETDFKSENQRNLAKSDSRSSDAKKSDSKSEVKTETESKKNEPAKSVSNKSAA